MSRLESPGFRLLRGIVLVVLGLIVAVPLLVVVTTSIEPLSEADDAFGWLPDHVTLTAYREMWSTVPLGRFLLNSVVVAVSSALLALVVATPAAYVLTRSRIRGRKAFLGLLVATQAAPGMLFLLPLYLVYARIADLTGITLIGSYAGLVLTNLTFALPLAIWMLRTQLEATPSDIEDAARVDGARTISVLRRVVVPLAAPGIAVVGLFAFVLAWNEVLFATVLTRSSTTTLPIGLHAYAEQAGVRWNELTAAAVVTSLPALVAVALARRVLVRRLDG
jgi:multiple sugar transport system permease protein